MSAHTLDQLRSGQLKGERELKLACGLNEFPPEILELAETLEVLDLSGNALKALPADFSRLQRLRIFFASDNAFTEVPEVLGKCPALSMVGFKANRIHHLSGQALPVKLRWLILTDNMLTALPAAIGRCTELQKLMLAGNQLRELPPELANCQSLELLRISANQLSALPKWLLQMPRLSWLACGGNPFTWSVEQQALENAPLPNIPWAHLRLEQQLGMGASGVIHQAQMNTHEGPCPVAVKLFKGRVTSDGWPQTEMAISLLTGAHPHLMPAVGQITGHPSGAQGLVMPLIDPKLENLAGPPNLESCTRDTYAPSTHLSLQSLLKLIQAIASAAQHLHQSGIVHGDLYAHNILHDGQGFALLGDFGASSVGAAAHETMAHALQRLEVRAFGCLLEELMDRCDQPLPASLLQLRDDCLSESPAQRPLFQDILHFLHADA
jgi:hypothetical protein